MAGLNGLFDIPPHQYFYLHGGRQIKNLYELMNSLQSMDSTTFSFHVNDSKNDFGNWIRDIVKDHELAENIFKTTDREGIVKEIKKHLYEKKNDEAHLELPPLSINDELLKKVDQILNKENEILLKEKELDKREEKILEIEEHIENRLSGKPNNPKAEKFFSKEFLQGLAIGFLLALILGLVYVKVWM